MNLNRSISQHLAPRKAAWLLARGRVGSQKCTRPNKLGNALGQAIGGALRPQPNNANALPDGPLIAQDGATGLAGLLNSKYAKSTLAFDRNLLDLNNEGILSDTNLNSFEFPNENTSSDTVPNLGTIQIPGSKKYDPQTSFFYDGPDGNAVSITRSKLPNGNIADTYGNGVVVQAQSGERNISIEEVGYIPLETQQYNDVVSRIDYINNKRDPNSLFAPVLKFFDSSYYSGENIITDRERNELTALRSIAALQVDQRLNNEKYSALLQRLDNISTLSGGTAYLAADALGADQETKDSAARVANATSGVAFALASRRIGGGPAYTGAISGPKFEPISPYTITSVKNTIFARKDVASKLTFDSSLNLVDKNIAIRASNSLNSDPVGSASYRRLQSQGTDVFFTNDPNLDALGQFDAYKNRVVVNMLRHSTAKEIVSTIVHEATHQNGFFNRQPQNSQFTEYQAFRNELLLMNNGKRPSLEARYQLYKEIQTIYKDLPQGKYPFGEQK